MVNNPNPPEDINVQPTENQDVTPARKDGFKIKRPFKERVVIWYSYNKQKLPFYLLIISVLIITGTLDFDPQTLGWEFESHFRAMTFSLFYSPIEWSIWISFIFFVICLLTILLFFLGFTYSRKRNLASTITVTVLGVTQLVMQAMYLSVIMTALPRLSTPDVQAVILNRTIIFNLISMVATLGAIVLCWIYTNWSYTKVDE